MSEQFGRVLRSLCDSVGKDSVGPAYLGVAKLLSISGDLSVKWKGSKTVSPHTYTLPSPPSRWRELSVYRNNKMRVFTDIGNGIRIDFPLIVRLATRTPGRRSSTGKETPEIVVSGNSNNPSLLYSLSLNGYDRASTCGCINEQINTLITSENEDTTHPQTKACGFNLW